MQKCQRQSTHTLVQSATQTTHTHTHACCSIHIFMQTHWRRIPQKVEVQNGPRDQELMCASRRKVYRARAQAQAQAFVRPSGGWGCGCGTWLPPCWCQCRKASCFLVWRKGFCGFFWFVYGYKLISEMQFSKEYFPAHRCHTLGGRYCISKE